MPKSMNIHEAIIHLEQALSKVKNKYQLTEEMAKHKKGVDPHDEHYQCGGAYWRVLSVAKFLEDELEKYEGEEHTAFLIKNHGRVVVE
ncbi:MAG: hypothetical protein Q9M28_06790 [Mariprofundaceae bacterium]|nr:hypothetical protein [Mariprofundaceae bacterium]